MMTKPNDPQKTEVPAGPPKRCAIYARYSSTLQRETSIDDQIRKCREYAAKRGWVVLDDFIFCDHAVSGAEFEERASLQRLLGAAEIQPRPFDNLLIDDTSRFMRDAPIQLATIKELQFHGINVVSVSQGLDSSNASSRLSFGIHAIIDEQFLVDLGNKVRRGQEGCVENGKYIAGGRCYGYKNVPDEHPTEIGEYGRPRVLGVGREQIPEEAAVVRRIFQMYADGLSLCTIARILRDEGVAAPRPPRKNSLRGWSADGIRALLQNEIYIGVYVWNRTQQVRHPRTRRYVTKPRPENEWRRSNRPEWQIVSDELWAKVKEQRARKAHIGIPKVGGLYRTKRSQKYLFGGLLYCSVCGRSIRIVDTAGEVVWYGCGTWRDRGLCTNNLRVRRDSLEKQLLQWLTQDLVQGEKIDQIVNSFHSKIQAHIAKLEAEARKHTLDMPALLKELAEERQEVTNITGFIAKAGSRAPLSLLDDLAKRDTRIKQIEERLAHAQDITGPMIGLTLGEVRDFVHAKLDDLQGVLTSSAEAGRQILQKHITKITLTPGEKDANCVYHVAVEFGLSGRGNSGVLLNGAVDASSQQYGFSTITVTGLALDLSRVRRKNALVTRGAEGGVPHSVLPTLDAHAPTEGIDIETKEIAA
jgi:DNA invertase Pin-like site-specific DNA recombinase